MAIDLDYQLTRTIPHPAVYPYLMRQSVRLRKAVEEQLGETPLDQHGDLIRQIEALHRIRLELAATQDEWGKALPRQVAQLIAYEKGEPLDNAGLFKGDWVPPGSDVRKYAEARDADRPTNDDEIAPLSLAEFYQLVREVQQTERLAARHMTAVQEVIASSLEQSYGAMEMGYQPTRTELQHAHLATVLLPESTPRTGEQGQVPTTGFEQLAAAMQSVEPVANEDLVNLDLPARVVNLRELHRRLGRLVASNSETWQPAETKVGAYLEQLEVDLPAEARAALEHPEELLQRFEQQTRTRIRQTDPSHLGTEFKAVARPIPRLAARSTEPELHSPRELTGLQPTPLEAAQDAAVAAFPRVAPQRPTPAKSLARLS